MEKGVIVVGVNLVMDDSHLTQTENKKTPSLGGAISEMLK